MSSWIGVYGHNQTELDWMKENYQTADKKFRKIHPVFESEDGRCEHGILETGSADDPELTVQYYWNISCHWDSGDHFKQTKSDIKAVLKELKSPKGLAVYLSPMVK